MHILWASQLRPDEENLSRIETAEALASLGHDVKMVVTLARWSRKDQLDLPDFLTYIWTSRFPLLRTLTFQIQFVFTLAHLLPHGIDVVVLDDRTIWGVFIFGCLARLRRFHTKFVLDVRSIPVDLAGISGVLRDWAFHLAIFASRYCTDGISVITPGTERVLRDRYGLGNQPVGKWCSGVDIDLFNPVVKAFPHVFPSHLEDRLKIIYHGVLSPNRGLQQTVKGVALARRQGIPAALVLLGDGPAREELEFLIEQEQLDNDVFLYPRVPHDIVPRYLAAADIGIVPLPDILWWRVSNPLKLMEYLAMGKPVIVTDIEAHRCILGDAECATYLSTVSPEEIARAIGKLYNKRDKLKQFGMVGRHIVEERYTWEVQARQFEVYLIDLVTGEVGEKVCQG